jgi:transketolase
MNPLRELIEYGQSFWLDSLSRAMLSSGELRRRIEEQGLRGVTSNPAIFNKAISAGSDYDARIGELTASGAGREQIYEELVTADVRDACDVLRQLYDQTDSADGYVSLEVSPHLAHNTETSIEEARRLWHEVDRPNLFIKIPGTTAGVPAIEALLREGINVNVTLLFSVARYQAVAEAYLRALEYRVERGEPVDRVASVASFFLSRIDTLVDRLLDHRATPGSTRTSPDPKRLQGKTAVANAKLAYARFTENLQDDRWHRLAQRGARPQRMLWASTSTKNPDYPDTMYVTPLIGEHTVNTMKKVTIDAFAHRGEPQTSVAEGLEAARVVMDELERFDIDLRVATEHLLNEGIQKFIDPFDALLETIDERRSQFERQHRSAPLRSTACRLRRKVIRMTTAAGSGHPTSCLSCADLVAALFFHEMRWDPGAADARDVDTFVLSKGHAAPVLWAALHEAGAIDEDPLSLRRLDSSLEGHPTPTNPWVRVATGSLGQGLAAANGIAVANRMDGIDARVFCLLGDGECAEGSVWEAAQFAAVHGLGSLVALVDVNALGQSGPTAYGDDTGVYARRFESFGWTALEIDGHDMQEILDALSRAGRGGPTAIIARTVKGKGVSSVEGKEGFHGKALDAETMAQALDELGEPGPGMAVEARRVKARQTGYEVAGSSIAIGQYGDEPVATRTAFGTAMEKLGKTDPRIVALDGDVQNSTRLQAFADAFPDRFLEGFIAEQNLVGTALGLASCGRVPVVATFACFLSRAYDFIRMAGHSRPGHLVFCGSHAGVSIGEDGPSQMGLEDIAMFRAVYGSSVLYPCDGVSAESLTEIATRTRGIVYLRTTRPKTPNIYRPGDAFEVGGSRVLRSSDHDEFTLVAAGITVHEALAACDSLREAGVTVRVIDAYSIKPLDVQTLKAAANETRGLITIEDHWREGGLGEAVAAEVQTPLAVLAVVDEPRSGTGEQLLRRHGISRESIHAQVLRLSGQG